jgi:hypothetical protein
MATKLSDFLGHTVNAPVLWSKAAGAGGSLGGDDINEYDVSA